MYNTAASRYPPSSHSSSVYHSPSLSSAHLLPQHTNCRPQKRCPVEDCGVHVIHIPRHLRECHGWTSEQSRSAVQNFHLRKTYHRSETIRKPVKFRDYHKPRQCPVEGCSAVVKRLTSHYKLYHKMVPGSHLYKEMIDKARQQTVRCRYMKDHRHTDEPEGEHSDKNELEGDEKKEEDMDELEDDTIGDLESHVDTDELEGNENPREFEGHKNVGEIEDKDDTEELERSSESEEFETQKNRISAVLEMQLQKFYTWMMSPDGGMRHRKSAKQHSTQVRAVLAATRQVKLSALWNNSVLDIFKKKMDEKKFVPTTVKGYLYSLKHLYEFTAAEGYCSTDDDARQLAQMKQRVAHWIAAYSKECGKHNLKKMNDDLNRLLKPQQIQQFKSSHIAISAIKIIGLCDLDKHCITQAEYVTVRDFLLTHIAIANANRSGVLANMTMKQFHEARLVDGQYVVSVDDHKTSGSYGAAKVVLTAALHSWMAVYAKDIRAQVVSHKAANHSMFLSWNGESLSSGQITRAVQSIWRKTGISGDITLNLVRKTAVSTMHREKPEMNAQLADLMCHRVTTAQKCYRLSERERTSVMASTELAKALARKCPENVERVQSVDSGNTATDVLVTVSERMEWSEAQIAALSTMFHHEIEANVVSLNTVRQKIKGDTVLEQISERKVYDKLRSEMRRCHSDTLTPPKESETRDERVARMLDQNTEENPDDADSEYIPPSSKAQIFSKTHVQTLQKLCSHIIVRGIINYQRIREALNKSTPGHHLLDRFTPFQLINRVKYERRQLGQKY